MKVVLTGASGAIGPFVLSDLEQEHEITLMSRRKVGSTHRQVIGDMVSSEDCLRALDGADAVVHLAAYSEPNPDALRFNTLSTIALLEAGRRVGIQRFIFASSNCVYGHCYRQTDRSFPLSFLPIDESHPCTPEDSYGLSKILCEQTLDKYSETWGFRSAALRLNWVWRMKEIQWRRDLTEFDVAGRASSFWAYVDARDCARAFRLALEAPNLPLHGAYNISAADHMVKEDSAELVTRFLPGVSMKRELIGRASFFDWQRAHDAFGFTPQYSWMEDER